MSNSPDVNLEDVCDFKFVGNFSAIQANVKTTFGYIRSVTNGVPDLWPLGLSLKSIFCMKLTIVL
jgi:hypothetical protein